MKIHGEALKMTMTSRRRMRMRMDKAKLYDYLATFCETGVTPRRLQEVGKWYLLIYCTTKHLHQVL
jgi:hypothetical protein